MARRSLIRTLYSSTQALGVVVKDAVRARQIAAVVARHGFAALLARRRRRLGDGQKTEEQIREEIRAEIVQGQGEAYNLGTRAVAMFEELGPTFIKFGQILSTRPDLIAPELIERLQRLQDRVAPVPLDEVKKQIEAALGGAPDKLFQRFDDVPIASASIAQVHGAVTHDGFDVVIKVQRPGIRPVIEADLSLLRFLAQQVIDVFPEAEMFDLAGMVSEFEASLLRELDFSVERQNIERFQQAFRLKERIHIPRVFPALSASTVLTMERVRGEKLTLITDETVRHDTAQVYLDAAYQMLFHDGFFHGDLHPGNVFLEADGRLGLIDFGMVGRLSRQNRERIVDVLFSLINEDLEGVARIWFAIGHPARHVDYAAFEAEVVSVLERHIVGRRMEEWDLGGFFRDLAQGAVKHGIRLPADFTMMFKAMVTTEGLARQIAKGINPVEAARPYIETLIKERYSLDRIKKVAFVEAVRVSDMVRELPGALERLLGRLEQGEQAVRLKHEGLSTDVTRLVRAMNRGAVSIVVAAAALTGAFTMEKGPQIIWGLSPVALSAFAIAFAGLIWLGVGVLKGR